MRRLARAFAAESSFEAFRDQPLTNILDGLPTATVRIGDLLIGPGRSIGIRLEQNLSPPHLLR